jgi:hypothetical protein
LWFSRALWGTELSNSQLMSLALCLLNVPVSKISCFY